MITILSCNSWCDTLTAIGTVGAVFATVFFFFWDRIRNYWKSPKLQIGINFTPPDCGRTKVTHHNKLIAGYWFRLFVKNTGRSSAKNLEVQIEKVEKKVGDKWERYSLFLPSNLKWTHVDTELLHNLLPGTSKNIDFGYITNPKEIESTTENENVFYVNISVKAITSYNIIAPGEYKFYLIAGSADCKPTKSAFTLKFSKEWCDDEDLMLNKAICITKIK